MPYNMFSTSRFRNIDNDHHKPPSPQPTLARHEIKIQRLMEEKGKSEKVIEILCRENSRIKEAHNWRSLLAIEEGKNLDRLQWMIDRLQRAIERVHLVMKQMIDLRQQNLCRLQGMMDQASHEWRDFCTEMNIGEAEIERVLEDIKERIIEKETQEILMGIDRTN